MSTPEFSSAGILKAQLAEITKKTPNKKAKPVDISKSAGIQYNAFLQRLALAVKKDVDEQLMPTVRKLAPQYQLDSIFVMDSYLVEITSILKRLEEKWTSPTFLNVAQQEANNFVGHAASVNRKRFNASMNSFGIDVFGDSPQVDEYLEASVFDNTKMITTIPTQYLSQVESIVLTNVRAGNRPAAMEKLLRDQYGVTQRRAKMIARDQTSKINGDLNAKRQTASGFDYFQWLDVDDIAVRERHDQIANKLTAYGKGIYRWDFPPLSDKGTPIIPGQDYQCRCTARPVSNAEVAANQKAGNVAKGVKR